MRADIIPLHKKSVLGWHSWVRRAYLFSLQTQITRIWEWFFAFTLEVSYGYTRSLAVMQDNKMTAI